MSRLFEDLPWHDAVILSIDIDRRRPGVADGVVLAMEWPDDRRSKIRFLECYAFDARLNFGVVAAETVRSAIERGSTDELERIRDKWRSVSVDLSALKSFIIETNSTASTIIIFARTWNEEFDES
jgi:hypothetical protein